MEIKLGSFDSNPTGLFDAISDIREKRSSAAEILEIEPDDRYKEMVAELVAPANFDPL